MTCLSWNQSGGQRLGWALAIGWAAIVAAAGGGAIAAVRLESWIDPDRLVPVSMSSVLQAVPVALFLYGVGIIWASSRKEPPGAVGIFSAAFAVRAIVSIMLALSFQYDDERAFHIAGATQMYGLISWDAGSGYYHVVSLLYALLGPNLLVPKMVNVFFGSVLIFLAYDLSRTLFSDSETARRVMQLAAFLPPLVIFSAVTLKEIPTAFLLVLIFWLAIVPRWPLPRRMLSTGMPLAMLYWLRGPVWLAAPLVGLVVYLVAYHVARGTRGRRTSYPLLIGAGAGILAALVLGPQLVHIAQSRLGQAYFVERFSESRATVTEFLDVSRPLSLQNLAVLLLRGFYAPSPLRFLFDQGLGAVLEAFGTGAWYLMFPLAVMGVVTRRNNPGVVACAATVASILVLATEGTMFGSDPYRHRIATLGLLVILSGGALVRNDSPRVFKFVRRCWWAGAWVFTVVWAVFRI